MLYSPITCIISSRMHPNICILCCLYYVVVTVLSNINVAHTLYRMEKDSMELTGSSPPKAWLIFMERRAWLCLPRLTKDGQASHDLFSYWSCFVEASILKHKCIYKPDWFICYYCCTFLKTKEFELFYMFQQFSDLSSLSISVHTLFSIKISINNFRFGRKPTSPYMTVTVDGVSASYKGYRYPWIILSKHSRAHLLFVGKCDEIYCATIIYDVVDKLTNKHVDLRTPSYVRTYTWGYDLIDIFHIVVEMLYRVQIQYVGCNSCTFIHYDGPNELFPRSMHKGKEYHMNITASTFQVLIKLARLRQNDIGTIRYGNVPVYKSEIDLRNKNMTSVTFDNFTQCGSVQNTARSCVYFIRSTPDMYVKLSVKNLKVNGDYSGSPFGAGFVVFSIYETSIFKVTEFYDSFANSVDVNITSSGNTMYVVIFSYSVYGQITTEAVFSMVSCPGINIDQYGKSELPYHQYIRRSGIEFYLQLNSIVKNTTCLNIQILPLLIKNFKHHYHIIVKDFHTALQVDFHQTAMSGGAWGFRREIVGHYYNIHSRKRNGLWSESYLGVYKSIVVRILHWVRNSINVIEIQQRNCHMPCGDIMPLSKNMMVSCNICSTFYLSSLTDTKHIKKNINPINFHKIDISLFTCEKLNIIIDSFRGTLMSLVVYYNITLRVKCAWSVQIPLSANVKCEAALPINTVNADILSHMGRPTSYPGEAFKIWRKFAYIFMSPKTSSWDFAAEKCRIIGGYLLTIHSQSEYTFIAREFIQRHNMWVTYIGMRKRCVFGRSKNIDTVHSVV